MTVLIQLRFGYTRRPIHYAGRASTSKPRDRGEHPPCGLTGTGVESRRMLVFRQLFDPQSATYTYLVADRGSREALLVDPVFEQARRDAALIEELGVRLKWTLETHVHADHVTGAWLLREKLGDRKSTRLNSS